VTSDANTFNLHFSQDYFHTPSSRYGTTIPPQINGSHPLQDFVFQNSKLSNSPCSLSPIAFWTKVHDLLTCASHRSTTPQLLRQFKFQKFQHSTFSLSWSSWSVNVCPSRSDHPDSLRLFELRDFQTPTHSFLPNFFHLKTMDLLTCTPLATNDHDLFWVFDHSSLSLTKTFWTTSTPRL